MSISGFGTLNKVALEFDKPFWNKKVPFFDVLPSSDGAKDKMMMFWMNMTAVSGKPILIGFSTGDSAVLLETMSEDDLKEEGIFRQFS